MQQSYSQFDGGAITDRCSDVANNMLGQIRQYGN
jgi:hypothetical protein